MLKRDRFSAGVAASRRVSPLATAAFAIAAASAVPAHAVSVVESGDAGESLSTAQITSGSSGSLNNIFGMIGSTTDADLYLINVTNPKLFSASTVNASTGDDIDTQLFLFTLAGAPVYTNDDDASGLTLHSTLPAGNSFGPVAAGTYYLGIALSGYDPVNANNQLLFATGLTTDTRGPAFGLQPAALGGFDGVGYDAFGGYDIQLTGAAVAAVPEPASALLWLLGAGALGLGRFARRQRETGAARAGTALPNHA